MIFPEMFKGIFLRIELNCLLITSDRNMIKQESLHHSNKETLSFLGICGTRSVKKLTYAWFWSQGSRIRISVAPLRVHNYSEVHPTRALILCWS